MVTGIGVLKHLEILSSDDYAGRKFTSEGSIKSQSYLVSILNKLNIPPLQHKYRHTFKKATFFKTKQGTNIIAYIPGTQYVDQYIVLTAHYDHLGVKRNKVYNGADDNASGTAALLHYGKVLMNNPLKHSVILLFTDGEEVNLLGAKAFISQQQKLLSKIKLNINLDMIAGNKRTRKLRFISKGLSQVLSIQALASFTEFQQQLKERGKTQLTQGFRNIRGAGSNINRTNWRMASDHGVFSQAGIPFIYFGVGTHKNYHSDHDDYANVNKHFFLAAIDSIFQQVTFLDNAISASEMVKNL